MGLQTFYVFILIGHNASLWCIMSIFNTNKQYGKYNS